MAGRLNEVNTSMDAVVNNVHAVDLVLGFQVGIETLLDIFDNRSPRVIVVNKVTKSRGIHNSQTKANSVFFNIGADPLDRHGLGDDVVARSLALLGRVQRSVEESVDQGRLSETGFTCAQLLALGLNPNEQ